MSDEADLLRAVLDRPLCDAPRTTLADWYDDHAGEAACPKCLGTGSHGLNPYELAQRYGTHRAGLMLDAARCGVCSGPGRVPNGYAARAEFIRVQCELAELGCRVADAIGGTWFHECRRDNYGTRVAALDGFPCEPLRDRGRKLYAGPVGDAILAAVPPMPGSEFWVGLPGDTPPPDGECGTVRLFVDRGFISGLRVPTLAVLLGRPCGRCDGDGRAHGADRPFEWSADVDYGKCVVCAGTGRAPGIAAAVCFAAHPVTRVVVADQEPRHFAGGDWSWWKESESAPIVGVVPDSVWHRLGGQTDTTRSGKFYPTREAALDALSRALVDHCRDLVGLPPVYAPAAG